MSWNSISATPDRMKSWRKRCWSGGDFQYQLRHLRLNDWLKDLKSDKDQLRILFNAAQDVSPETDAKLQELKKLIAAKVAAAHHQQARRANKKVLVFTAFADTASYLYESLCSGPTRTWASMSRLSAAVAPTVPPLAEPPSITSSPISPRARSGATKSPPCRRWRN